MKVVVNRCFGGFGLSDEAVENVMNRKGFNCFRYEESMFGGYVRCKKFQRSILGFYSTKDLGQEINYIPRESYWYEGNLDRDDPDLIAVVEELGERANGRCAELEVVEIPDDVKWEIDDYDGIETIHEVHRKW